MMMTMIGKKILVIRMMMRNIKMSTFGYHHGDKNSNKEE